MIGAVDANLIINLAKGQIFHHLRRHFARLYVPPAVEREVVHQGEGHFGADELQEAVNSWIERATPGRKALDLFASGPPGDRELLAVAWEKGVDVILTDDLRIIARAATIGIPPLGVRDLLLLFKRQGDIPSVKPVLDLMRSRQWGIPARSYREILRVAGEED